MMPFFGKKKTEIPELREMVLRRQRRRLSMFNRIALWFHYPVIIALLLAATARFISPTLFWLPAFFGLAFPHIFVVNLIFVIYWMAQFKPVALFGTLALLVSLPMVPRYVQVSFSTPSHEKVLRVTSYNSMLFDLYNWTHNVERRAQILNNLAQISPDIVCLQEFYTSEEKNDFNNIDTVRKLLRMNHHHCEFTTTLRETDHWGIGTFSKFPIINQGKIEFNTRSNNICIYSDIVLGSDTVRVYNVHLQSISFSKKDNQFLDDVISEKEAQNEVENSKNILRRLKRAFVKRAEQVRMIETHMKTCRYKIILCGDFNDTAASYAYERLTGQLRDAFVEKGSGIGRTYAGRWPRFRIDYILHDPGLRCVSYDRSSETYTDHYPITASFENIRWN